jgi:hypothetical protein
MNTFEYSNIKIDNSNKITLFKENQKKCLFNFLH